MSRSRSRSRYQAVTGVVAVALLLSACGSNGDDSGPGRKADPNAEVTISVMMLPPKNQKAQREAFLARVERFQKKNPNITVKPEETRYAPETFQAMLAGGTLPTVIHVPFTEPQGLIQRRQVSDITAEFDGIEQFQELNQQLLEFAKDDQGRIYGIPVEAYDLGLAYNRALFQQAGLNPDAPPTTWDQVREAAKAITAKTGQAGYAQMTTDNTGGWMFTTLVYTFGGSVQEQDGNSYRASFNSPAGKQALEYLRTLRWGDDVMGDNFLMSQAQLRTEFAAGKIGMYIETAGGLNPLANNFKFDPAHYGFGPLPQQGGVHGTLAGGAMAMIAPDATPEERLAGLKWIYANYLERFFDQAYARELQQARADDGLIVGIPQLQPVNRERIDEFNSVIADLVNIPLENFKPYTSTQGTIPLIAEPPVGAQETYSVLDSVVQAVLTRKDADIGKLLREAEANVNSLISAR